MRHLLLTALLLVCAAVVTAADPTPPAGDRPRLGIQIEDNAFDVSQGLPVLSVQPGGTAAALGLQAGDGIKSINGKAVARQADLLAGVGELKVGMPLTLEVMRQGKPLTLSGTVLAPSAGGAVTPGELTKIHDEVNDIKAAVDARTREPTLAELIRELQMLEQQFPKAAAEFKKLYPNGEFSIVIRITSDKTAPDAIDLMKDPRASLPGEGPNARQPTPAPAPAPQK